MPDSRHHRGPHPEDAEQFAARVRPTLNRATQDLSWLLSHGYAAASALKLVGDRFQLTRRQRLAVLRSACSDEARVERARRHIAAERLRGQPLEIDAFNVLTTIEAALAGGVLLRGRDGCLRDMASMHGSYRAVAESQPALERIGAELQRLGAEPCIWWLDRPVSNSGRLGQLIRRVAAEHGWAWEARLSPNVDRELVHAAAVIASADSAVIDRAARWFNLAAHVVTRQLPDVLPLRLDGQQDPHP